MTNAELALTAFAGAVTVSLAATPAARLLALRWRVLDQPGAAKNHGSPTPYLGGFAILAGAAVVVLATGAWRELGAVLAGGLLLCLMGLADDIQTQNPWKRLAMQAIAAGIAISAGLRAQATGIDVIDYTLTFVWIVGITNAFNLLDNMNGLSAGTALSGAASIAAIALANGQRLVGAFAATIAGGALGFLPYNFPKASIFMGDAGSLMLGFFLSVLALKLRFPIDHPWSFLVPVTLLGLAVLDTSVAVAGRVMSKRPIMIGATDHLSHRLVRIGFSRPVAVLTLAAGAVVFGVVAFFVGRGLISPALLIAVDLIAVVAGLLLLLRVDVSQPMSGPAEAAAEAEAHLRIGSLPTGNGMIRSDRVINLTDDDVTAQA